MGRSLVGGADRQIQRERERERERERDIMAPNSQQASTNEEERVIPEQQDIGEDEQSPPQPPPTQDANNCAAPNCVDPDGTHANYTNWCSLHVFRLGLHNLVLRNCWHLVWVEVEVVTVHLHQCLVVLV